MNDQKITTVLLDIDGVINVLDAPESHELRDAAGRVTGYLDLQREVVDALKVLVEDFSSPTVRFLWMSSWNEKSKALTPFGLPDLDHLPVDRDREADSKIEGLLGCAASGPTIWVDDFVEEWADLVRSRSTPEVMDNVLMIQSRPHGLDLEDLAGIEQLVGRL